MLWLVVRFFFYLFDERDHFIGFNSSLHIIGKSGEQIGTLIESTFAVDASKFTKHLNIVCVVFPEMTVV